MMDSPVRSALTEEQVNATTKQVLSRFVAMLDAALAGDRDTLALRLRVMRDELQCMIGQD